MVRIVFRYNIGYKLNCSFLCVFFDVRKLNIFLFIMKRVKIGCGETNWKEICKKVDIKVLFKLVVMKCVYYSEIYVNIRVWKIMILILIIIMNNYVIGKGYCIDLNILFYMIYREYFKMYSWLYKSKIVVFWIIKFEFLE